MRVTVRSVVRLVLLSFSVCVSLSGDSVTFSDLSFMCSVGDCVGIACSSDTFQVPVCTSVPFSLLAIADTFHVPVIALIFV